jgi:hypothetical protein
MHEEGHSRRSSSWQRTFALQLLCLLLASSCHGLSAELPAARRLANSKPDGSSNSTAAAAGANSHECTSLKQLQCLLTGRVCDSGTCADAAAVPPPAEASPTPDRQAPGNVSRSTSSCSKHSDCSGTPATPYCILTPAGFRCRANCTADVHCRGVSARPFCLQNKCRSQQCFYDVQCSSRQDMSSRPFCVDIAGAKRCRQCGQDSHCSSVNPRRAACFTKNSTCVQVSSALADRYEAARGNSNFNRRSSVYASLKEGKRQQPPQLKLKQQRHSKWTSSRMLQQLQRLVVQCT